MYTLIFLIQLLSVCLVYSYIDNENNGNLPKVFLLGKLFNVNTVIIIIIMIVVIIVVIIVILLIRPNEIRIIVIMGIHDKASSDMPWSS